MWTKDWSPKFPFSLEQGAVGEDLVKMRRWVG